MLDIRKNTKITTSRSYRLELDGDALLQLVNQELKARDASLERIPTAWADVSIYVEVPGGGDWSSTELELRQHPVIIEWTVTEENDQ